MQRHILNKRKPSYTHISPHVTLQMLKNSSETTLRKVIQILKKTLDERRLPTISDRKPTIRNKVNKRESKLLKEEKEILPFMTQYQPSVSTIKEA